MDESKKIIVTLTSWSGRIDIVGNTIESLLDNTLIPDKIILNLSEDEFPGREEDLPGKLVSLVNEHENCEIFWVKENTKQFKKLIPTLERFPDDIVISADDDFIYNDNFISTLYNDFKANGFQHPVTTWENTTMTTSVYGNLKTHNGQGTITMSKFYGNYLKNLYDELVVEQLSKGIRIFDDALYTYAALLNGITYSLASVKIGNLIKKNIVTTNGVSVNNTKELLDWHDNLRKFILKRFNKTFIKGFGFVGVSNDEAKEITFIIPNRGGDKINEVIKNFNTTFAPYFDNIQFIVIEQCDNDIFKKGQLFNIAFSFVKTSFMALIDNDIFNMDSFDIVKKYKELGGAYLAFDEITQITLDEDSEGYNVLYSEKRLGGFGAFQVMRREDFIKANGFSNLCLGWGAEDDVFNYRINFKRWKHKLGHINHPRRINLYPYSTKNNKRVLNLHKTRTILPQNDSFIHTTYNLKYQNKIENVEYIGVDSIAISNDFVYKSEYETATNVSKIGLVNTSETIVITMTSWKARIGNIPTVLDSIFKQTKLPNKIVLNLSIEEFPNKETDLPTDVVSYIDSHKTIEINWLDGVNTKQWKKIIPTLLKYPDVWTICIDDDKIYPSTFINDLWNTHLEYPNNPITLNKSYKVKGFLQHAGIGTLECAKFYNNFKDIDLDFIRESTESSDTVFTYLLNKNGHALVPITKNLRLTPYNDVFALSKTVKTCSVQTHLKIWEILVHKYGDIKPVKTDITTQQIVKKKENKRVVVNTPQTSASSFTRKKTIDKRDTIKKPGKTKQIISDVVISKPLCSARKIKIKAQQTAPCTYNELKQIKSNISKPVKINIKQKDKQGNDINENLTQIKHETRVLENTSNDSVVQRKLEAHSKRLIKKTHIRKNGSIGFFR